MSNSATYEQDFFAWTSEQARLLREGRAADADLANIAEEIESLGRAQRSELVNRLSVLLQHLLKWSYQPERRGASWEVTIKIQRRDIAKHLRDNPSLGAFAAEAFTEAYDDAKFRAGLETSLPKDSFPAGCPYPMKQALDDDFWPSLG